MQLPDLYYRREDHGVIFYRPTEDGGTEYLGKIEGADLSALFQVMSDAQRAWVVDGRVSGRIK